jgi:voltage-gated potassium channel
VVRRLAIAVAVLGGVLAFGTLGYMLVEHWRFFDALYMTVITVGTVGFGEVHPLSQSGRAFTMVLILAGVAGLGYVFATVVEFFVEGHLREILEERRMERLIDRLDSHHIVAGLGRVGLEVAGAFEAADVPFAVVDNCQEVIQAALERGWPSLLGDATEEHVLRAAGIERASSLVTALDSDAANVFVTLTARTLNPKLYIVARSAASSAEDKLRKAGADSVITPTVIGGRRMATMVLHPFVSDYLELMSGLGESEMRLEEIQVPADSCIDGCRLTRVKELETGSLVLAVQHPDGSVVANPPSDTMLQAGARLVVMGTADQLEALADTLEKLD